MRTLRWARVYYGGAKTRVFLCDRGRHCHETGGSDLHPGPPFCEAFPNLEKVTTYAGPRSTLSKTPEQLAELRRHGLVRAYLG